MGLLRYHFIEKQFYEYSDHGDIFNFYSDQKIQIPVFFPIPISIPLPLNVDGEHYAGKVVFIIIIVTILY